MKVKYTNFRIAVQNSFFLAVMFCQLIAGWLCLPVNSQASNNKQASPPALPNNTLLIMSNPHVDRDKFKLDLEKEFKVKVIKDMHVNGEDYSTLEVQPAKGQTEATLTKILAKKDPRIKSVTRNYLCRHQ